MSAWSMLAGTGGPDGWAQIGYVAKNYGTIENEFFYQYGKLYATNPKPTLFWGTPVTGTSYNFKVGYDSTSNSAHIWLDGTDVAQTNFDPLAAWSGTNSQWYEEEWNDADDQFGLTGSRTQFNNVESKGSSGTWSANNWNQQSSTPLCYNHVHEINSTSHFEVWTEPLDHSC